MRCEADVKRLALDLSTSCTGYAILDAKSNALLQYGRLKPSTKGLKDAVYPFGQLRKMEDLSLQIQTLVAGIEDLGYIVIEEINKGAKSGRLGQKTLDGFHYVLMTYLKQWAPLISFCDSDGATGWRTHFKLNLTKFQKDNNAKARKLNKKIARGLKKFPVVSKKDLACQLVNARFGLNLDCQENETDGDIADAVGLGLAAGERQR